MIKKRLTFLFVAAFMMCCCKPSSSGMSPEGTPSEDPSGPVESTDPDPISQDPSEDGPETPEIADLKVELSYWVDCDMLGYHRRGYWYKYSDYSSESAPDPSYITKGAEMLVNTYQANLLYVFYHRQFEIDKAKEVFLMWKDAGAKLGIHIVPTVLLQDYSNSGGMNFTDEELVELAKWCHEEISEEFGIFDVYSRQAAMGPQDVQLKKLVSAIGDNLVFVGFQPNVSLNSSFKRAVEDTWTAECQGNTNELWSNPLGGQNVGKKLLDSWVNQRVVGEKRPVTWDLIPVAWDYEETTAKDEYGYVCPGDNALYNDPPIPGRLFLCRDAIVAHYQGGYTDALFGGFSCDLTILQANSAGCQRDKVSFYKAIRTGKKYEGYFSSAIDEIAEVYASVKELTKDK